MRQLAAFTLVVFLVISLKVYGDEKNIHWMTNYEKAVTLSESSSKPILLFFTGSDWCSWCKKLDEEVLSNPQFIHEVSNKFIFVKVDFPINSPPPPEIAAQNKELQKKYDVRSFPTIVLLNSKQQKIGVTGYRSGGAKAYADHLLKMIRDYHAYHEKMRHFQDENLSGSHLMQLYEKAQELSLSNDADRIVKAGMDSDQKLFFLIKRYRSLADMGRLESPEALLLRRKLLETDPTNEKLTHYNVAIIEFESYCAEKEKSPPELAVSPLVEYIEKFGDQDKHHLWRLLMVISQVYFDYNNLPEALKYAQYSYDTAPSSAQAEIQMAIKNIQSQISTHNNSR